jgi:hypothetical protein
VKQPVKAGPFPWWRLTQATACTSKVSGTSWRASRAISPNARPIARSAQNASTYAQKCGGSSAVGLAGSGSGTWRRLSLFESTLGRPPWLCNDGMFCESTSLQPKPTHSAGRVRNSRVRGRRGGGTRGLPGRVRGWWPR